MQCNIIFSQHKGDATKAIVIDPAGPFCSGGAPVMLTATPTGGSWDGPGITNSILGTFDPGIAGFGLHTITYTADGSSASIQIVVNSSPTAVINYAGPFCIKDGDTHLSLSQDSDPSGTWSGNGVSPIGIFSPGSAGIGMHVIRYTVTKDGCTGADFIEIEVGDIDQIVLKTVDPVCSNAGIITLQADPAGGTWSGEGVTQGAGNKFDPSEANIGYNKVIYEYTIGGCSEKDSMLILIYESINAAIDSIGPVCESDGDIILTSYPSGGIWKGMGIVDYKNGVFNPANAMIGENEISYIILDNNCSDTATIVVNVSPGFLGVEPVIKQAKCYGEPASIEFAVLGGAEPFVFSWGTTEGHVSDTSFIESIYAGNYLFTITDSNNCNFELENIEIKESDKSCLNITNAFTPNNDGYNDYWEISNINNFSNPKIIVFNNWGQVVFKSTGEYTPWNGNYLHNNKPLPAGSYMYTIELKENNDFYKGIVTIVR